MTQAQQDTQLAIMRTAEKLFASRGVDAVSLAEINRQAGQKNQKAATYHFGNKAGLLAAILDRHSVDIESHRQALMHDLDESAPMRALVEAVVLPIAIKLDDEDGGVDFLRLSGQLLNSAEYARLRFETVQKRSCLVRVLELMRPHVAHLTSDERAMRNLVFDQFMHQGLCLAASTSLPVSRERYIEFLVDTLVQVSVEEGSA